jgi:hypothetical protein
MARNNIGEMGKRSIRIGGKRISELNVVDQMRARQQIELTEEQAKKKAILDKYPPYKVPNLKAGIKEARENIQRFTDCIAQENKTIEEYTVHLALCEQRDKELKAGGFD